MRKNLEVAMWSSSSIDLKNVDLILDSESRCAPEYEPTPYMFTTLENGKKTAVDSTFLSPPSWLLLDHTVAVIWSMFSANSTLLQLSIDDLKWAYEFLREIRNRKGENPPDVKVCLRKIQDRLISLYARLTSKQEDFDEIAAAFGEKIMADPTTNYLTSSFIPKVEFKADATSITGSLSPSMTTVKIPLTGLYNRHSSKDLLATVKNPSANHKRIAMNYSKKTIPLLEKDSDLFEESGNNGDEEVEKYFLSLFDGEKREEQQERPSTRSLIPTKRKTPTTLTFSEMVSSQDPSDVTKKEKTSKKIHCVAEMRSLKFQKSMKVQDANGEEAAYSNLKAEIRRLTINPNVSRDEVMKFLKEWRSGQVDRLHNELKRLNSIEEFMESISTDGYEPNLRLNSPLKLKQLETAKSNYTLCKSLFS